MDSRKFIDETIVFDSSQILLIQKLERIKKDISRTNFAKIFKNNKYFGAYIYGPVGRGKTVIAKIFYDSIKFKKNFYHYQSFVKYLHEQAHILFIKNEQDPVVKIADTLTKNYKFICIDELEIRDIADAMIMQRLCELLIKRGVFLVFTSNIKPSDLYNDGLQRELFQKFIDIINKKFFVHNLLSVKDYRFGKITSDKNVILYPANADNIKLFEEMLNVLTHNQEYKETSIIVFGRMVNFKKCYKNTLYSDFVEMFESQYSYNDYLSITEKYDAIIITKFGQLPSNSDIIIRFINFIDSAYMNKVMLVTLLEVCPEELYSGSRYKKEFQRAISRIVEMNSEEYILNTKYHKGNNE